MERFGLFGSSKTCNYFFKGVNTPLISQVKNKIDKRFKEIVVDVKLDDYNNDGGKCIINTI